MSSPISQRNTPKAIENFSPNKNKSSEDPEEDSYGEDFEIDSGHNDSSYEQVF